jgi:hypothetical protein
LLLSSLVLVGYVWFIDKALSPVHKTSYLRI